MTQSIPAVTTTLGPRCMIRVAGLPFDVVAGLRQPKSVAWAEEVLAEQAWLAEQGAQLSDLLHPLVSATEDDKLRRMVVNTRRKVFTGAWPKDGAEVAAIAGGETGALLTEWMRRHQGVLDLLAQPVLSDELAEARARLRELAEHPRLRQGLLLASASLDTYLGSYLKAGDKLSKKQRRIERSLTEYVYRAACKTSPFSTFTGVAVGEFTDDAPGIDLTVDEDWTDHTQLAIAVLGRFGELVRTNPDMRPDLVVSLTSGWTTDTDRVRYVRRTVTAGDDTTAASFDAVSETMFFLRHGGGLDVLITLFDEAESMRYAELLDAFAERVSATRDECDKFLSILLRLGLLAVPALAVDIHATDPLLAFAESVHRLGRAWSTRLADDLRAVAELVHAYRSASLPERRRLLADVRERLGEVQASLGEPDGTLPQTLVYEDTRAADQPLPLDHDGFDAGVGRSLAQLSRIMPAFDMALPHRLTLRGFFLTRYGVGGQCDDLLELVTSFQEDLYDHYVRAAGARRPFTDDGEYVPADNWLDQPEITAVDQARIRFAQRMRDAVAAAGPAAHEVVLDDDVIDDVAAELRPLIPGFRPESHFVQLSTAPGEPRAVLNRSWGGLAFPFSRFTHGFTDQLLTEQIRVFQRGLSGGAVFAEVTGGAARTNLNLHGRLTDYEIVCPGETSTAVEQAQIPLADLVLRHDPESGRLVLRSKRLDREVIPVYFGYLVPVALPEISRTLLLLSPSAMVSVDPWGGVPVEPADGVVRKPRVRHGDVVISRRSWELPVEALPLPTPETTPGKQFVRWQEFRRRHGIDRQVFVTPQPRIDPDATAPPRREKPHYLDFDSPLSLELFTHLISDGFVSVTVREMLPGAAGLHTKSSAGTHVTEVVVETFTEPSEVS